MYTFVDIESMHVNEMDVPGTYTARVFLPESPECYKNRPSTFRCSTMDPIGLYDNNLVYTI